MDGDNIDPKVLDEIRREIGNFGPNIKELKDSTQRDLKAVRDLVDDAKGKITPEVKAQVDALGQSVLEKSDALEKGLGNRMDEIEAKLNRPRAGASDKENKEADDLFELHRQSLSVRGELKVGRPVDRETTNLDDLRAYTKLVPMYLRRGDQVLDSAETKLLMVGSDPDGGYLVTPQIMRRILTSVYESSPMRDIANVETISTDAIEFPTDDGEAGAGWVGETEDRPETSTPQLGVQRIPVHEQYAMPKATQKLLEDASMDVEAWLGAKIGQKFGRLEATAFIAGNGVKKPRGILTYPTGSFNANGIITRGTVEQIASGSTGVVTSDALVRMAFLLKEAYYANARWLMRRATVPEIMVLKDTTGRYLWQPSLALGQPNSLLGYPISQAADMPAIATGAFSIAFGDWKQAYTIVDRLGLTTLRDPYTAKPFVLFYTRRRVGGDVTNFEAYKLMKIA